MLVLYGNIFKVTRNRLTADGRLRRAGSFSGQDPAAARPEVSRTAATTTTPLRLTVRSRLTASSPAATTTTFATGNRLQRRATNSDDSSAGSSDDGRPSCAVTAFNIEYLEMNHFDEENRTATRCDVDRPDSDRARPTSTRRASSALDCRTVRRYGSSSTLGSSHQRRGPLSNFRYLSNSEWRRAGVARAAAVRREMSGASRRENKAAKTLAIVVGGFVVCWLPFFVLYVVEPFCSSCRVSDALRSALTWLGYANSLVNPFIYATYNRHFRHSFWRLTVGQFHACLMSRTDRPNDVTESPASI